MPAGAKPARVLKFAAGFFAVMLPAAAGAAFWWWSSAPPALPIDTESEAQIDAAQPCVTKISHLAEDPDVIVLDFPNLTIQGLMLDRVAALVEKAHLPRDRVLDDAALYEAIYNCGDTIESYYYGHDYRAADLARFFALAAQGGVTLNQQELWLRRLVRQLGWLEPGANGALITLPAAAGPVTQEMRAVILHHEIAHGAFFTTPAYAAYSEAFWNSLSPADRAGFTGFLGRQGYDTSNNNLMLNETEAYLVFTTDPQFFDAAAVQMDPAHLADLRNQFIANMPDFWLRPLANETLPVGNAPACAAAP